MSRTERRLSEPTIEATDVDHEDGHDRPAERSVAAVMAPMLEALLGSPPPVRFEFWDDSHLGPADSVGALRINSRDALRRIIWAPGELGFARALVTGDADIIGPMADVLRTLQSSMPDEIGVGLKALPAVLRAANELDAIGKPLPAPPEEIVPRGRRHSIRRDRQAVSHHYDVGNDFYRLLLGPSMTYSCARFADREATLEAAQASKHELICRKLGLHDRVPHDAGNARLRLLDVGCGWGEMAIHAARHHDVDVVGVTISVEQAARARERVAEAGLGERVEIRVQDYRVIDDGPFDAISSIGMAEHVGGRQIDAYFETMFSQLVPGGRMMNHAIASIGGSRMSRNSFVGRYVFPDGELLDLADTIAAMEAAGFEVRDVENLREHYEQTLRHWVDNLESAWDQAVELVGERRARVWRLYLSGSMNGFEDGGLQLQQTLGVKWSSGGHSHMPATRAGWQA